MGNGTVYVALEYAGRLPDRARRRSWCGPYASQGSRSVLIANQLDMVGFSWMEPGEPSHSAPLFRADSVYDTDVNLLDRIVRRWLLRGVRLLLKPALVGWFPRL